MEIEVYEWLKANPKIHEFVRRQPMWYRYLSRDGIKRLPDLEKEAKIYYGQTISGRLNRVNDQVQMAAMLINVANLLKD